MQPAIPSSMNAHRAFPPMPQTDEVEIASLLETIRRARWFVLLVVVVSLVLAVVWVLRQPSRYTTVSLVRVSSGVMEDGEVVQTASEMETLRSKLLMLKVLEDWIEADILPDLPLYIGNLAPAAGNKQGNSRLRPYHQAVLDIEAFHYPSRHYGEDWELLSDGEGAFRLLSADGVLLLQGEAGGRPVRSASGDIELHVRDMVAPAGLRWKLRLMPRSELADAILKRLDVSKKAQDAPDVLLVELSSGVPDVAERFSERLIQRYLVETVARRTAGMEKALGYLEKSLLQYEEEIAIIDQRLRDVQESEGVLNLSKSEQYLLEQMKQLQYVRSSLQADYDKNRVDYTDQHPAQRGLRQQIESVDADIGQLESRLQRLPGVQYELVQLMRQMENLKQAVRDNEEKRNELHIAIAKTHSYSSMLDKPKTPATIDAPRSYLILFVAMVVSTVLALMVALLRDSLLLARAREPHRLRRMLDTPVYAMVPWAPGAKRHKGERLHVLNNRDTHTYRAISAMAASVEFLTRSAPNNVIAITSDGDGVGKSFVALNFAAMCASRQRVLLVDANLQNPAMHGVFQLEKRPGLSGLIIGKHEASDVLQEVVAGKLWLMPAGATPPNTEVLLAHPRFEQIMEQLSEQFDVVVVDYPAQDACDVNPHDFRFAGTVVMVAAYGQAMLRLRRFVMRFRHMAGRKVDGIVLNQVPDFGKLTALNVFTW